MLGVEERIEAGEGSHRGGTLAEKRVLVGLLAAASALGPVVAMLSPFPNGPLSWFSDVVAVAQ